MKRFPRIKQATRRGFSKWIQPRMSKYLMACCDCNLIHELQFRIHTKARGSQHVQFRARRAERDTKALRKRDGLTIIKRG